MAAEEPRPSAASCCTDKPALSTCWRDEGEEEDERDPEHNMELNREEELKEPQRSSSDESEESEPEPPPPSVVRRKVSFADAFGLDLVSVKEFDSRVENGPENMDRLLGVETRQGEEYYLSCFFTVPASDDELSVLLQENKLELESIELLPGSTTMRGIIRVLNLSYHKAVYVRMTLDAWQSHFDLLAEYTPGSSDGQTDRFSFKLTLVPPFQPTGTRVEFCLRYESSAGTFWANNGGINYVLFCHQRGGRELKEKEGEKENEKEEESNHKGKKSCLKARRKYTGASGDLSEPESSRSEESEEERSQHEAESRSTEALEACRKALAERRSRRRTARLARMQDYFSQRESEVQLGYNLQRERTEKALKVAMPAPELSTPVGLDFSGAPRVNNIKDQDTPPILTYHQIPLLSLDWGKRVPSHPHTAEISSDAPQRQEEQKSTESSTDVCDTFLSGTDSSDTHANTVDQECLLCVASLPSHAECDLSTPGENVLPAKTPESPLTNRSQGCVRPEETLESGPTARWQDVNSSHAEEQVLGYKYPEEPEMSSKTHSVQQSEQVWEQPGSEAQKGHISTEKAFDEDASLPEASPSETAQTDATDSEDSRKAHVDSPEECAVSSYPLCTEKEEVKGETCEAATLTFTGMNDEPLTDSHIEQEESFEEQHTDETKEPKQVKEGIDEVNGNGPQMNVSKILNEYPEDLIEGLETQVQVLNEELSLLRDQSTEFISESESVVFDEKELDARTEWTDREALKSPEEEESVCHRPAKEELAKSIEEISFVVLDYNVADRKCEINSTSEMEDQDESYIVDEIIQGTDHACNDFITAKESNMSHSTNNTSTNVPTLFTTSHASDPSQALSWTESVSEPLLFSGHRKSFEFMETLSHKAAQNLEELQDPQDSEHPPPLSRSATPSVDTMSFRLLTWWTEFCSLSHKSRALLYVILFVIFITVDFHDLPACLAIYLFSVCWWCGQGMKKRVATADNLD